MVFWPPASSFGRCRSLPAGVQHGPTLGDNRVEKPPLPRSGQLGAVFLVAGAVGNLVDRLYVGGAAGQLF